MFILFHVYLISNHNFLHGLKSSHANLCEECHKKFRQFYRIKFWMKKGRKREWSGITWSTITCEGWIPNCKAILWNYPFPFHGENFFFFVFFFCKHNRFRSLVSQTKNFSFTVALHVSLFSAANRFSLMLLMFVTKIISSIHYILLLPFPIFFIRWFHACSKLFTSRSLYNLAKKAVFLLWIMWRYRQWKTARLSVEKPKEIIGCRYNCGANWAIKSEVFIDSN